MCVCVLGGPSVFFQSHSHCHQYCDLLKSCCFFCKDVILIPSYSDVPLLFTDGSDGCLYWINMLYVMLCVCDCLVLPCLTTYTNLNILYELGVPSLSSYTGCTKHCYFMWTFQCTCIRHRATPRCLLVTLWSDISDKSLLRFRGDLISHPVLCVSYHSPLWTRHLITYRLNRNFIEQSKLGIRTVWPHFYACSDGIKCYNCLNRIWLVL